jgi:hypothetical protein
MYYTFPKARPVINSGPDIYTSVKVRFYSVNDSVRYELTNLSSGRVSSVDVIDGIINITVTGITRNSKFSARLVGVDDLGHTDEGLDISGAVVKSECSNSICYVGIPWKVETLSWSAGSGILSLQEKIAGKWVSVKSSKPITGVSKSAKYPVTYSIVISYSAPGKHTYRLYLAASKKYSAFTGLPFTQVVQR